MGPENGAKQKLPKDDKISFVSGDILEYCLKISSVEVVTSTYALHHLTTDEKHILLSALGQNLPINGLVVIGDLMFKDQSTRDKILSGYLSEGKVDLVRDIEAEYYWDVLEALRYMAELGLHVTSEQTGELSWVLTAQKL